MKVRPKEVPWYHFWNPQSGGPGALLFCGVLLTGSILVSLWLG